MPITERALTVFTLQSGGNLTWPNKSLDERKTRERENSDTGQIQKVDEEDKRIHPFHKRNARTERDSGNKGYGIPGSIPSYRSCSVFGRDGHLLIPCLSHNRFSLTLQNKVVTICTTSFTIKRNPALYPQSVFMG
jgi:hypothetical protein